MAIVFSYPSLNSSDVQPSDRLLLSQMTVEGNPTKSLTISNLRQYLGAVVPANPVTGGGTTNKITKWTNGPGRVIGDSSIEDTGSEINVPYRLNINNATTPNDGISFINPSGLPSGIVRMYYNGAVQGSRFLISRGASGGAEIELEASGDVNINRTGLGNFLAGGEVTLDDYGSGVITGIPTFNLEVDATGKIIETAGGAGGIGGTGTINAIPKFTAANTIGDSSISDDGALIEINNPAQTNDVLDIGDELRANGAVGNSGDVLTSLGGSSAPTWTNRGYKSVQVFQWTAGNPVVYTNFPIGTTSALPFDPTPLVETGTYPGTPADNAWTCLNQAGGTATEFAEFTLGIDGGGTWEISTAQHWFDQNQFLEVNVDFRINGTLFAAINERVNDGAGDRLFYGSLVRDFTQGNTVRVEITFANGTGSAPFPAATNNRPIEVTFTKLV